MFEYDKNSESVELDGKLILSDNGKLSIMINVTIKKAIKMPGDNPIDVLFAIGTMDNYDYIIVSLVDVPQKLIDGNYYAVKSKF